MKRTLIRRLLAIAAAVMVCLVTVCAHSANYIFTNIADNTMAAPVGTLNPVSGASISNGVVAFTAQYNNGALEGIFTGSGGPLSSIIQEGDAAPTGFFTGISEPSISDGKIAFTATYDGGKHGVFVANGGTLTTIAKFGDPAAVGTFTDFRSASISGHNVAFFGDSTAVGAIYRSDGSMLTTIAKTGDVSPAGLSFTGVIRPAISGDNVAFTGAYSGGNGVFVGSGGPLTTIVKTGDAAPEGTFVGGDSAAISGSNVIFMSGYGPSGGPTVGGTFMGNGGDVTTIALAGDPAPVGTFDQIGPASIHGSLILLDGLYGGYTNHGIFITNGGSPTSVIKSGDTLFGATVLGVGLGRHALDQDGSARIVFSYSLADGREGIAMATPVPEPGSVAVFALGVAFAVFVRRRKR
jgi:hypothetical protein